MSFIMCIFEYQIEIDMDRTIYNLGMVVFGIVLLLMFMLPMTIFYIGLIVWFVLIGVFVRRVKRKKK